MDLDDTAKLLREQVDAVEAKFRASVEAEKTKEDVLARKFAEGLKKAKDSPIEKPLRDFESRLILHASEPLPGRPTSSRCGPYSTLRSANSCFLRPG